jgi:hypothetical protein
MTPEQMLKRALAGTQSHTPQPVTDEFAKAVAKRLESRGIAKVPGLPDEEEDWPAKVLEFLRAQRDLEERAAERQAEREAAQDEHTAPQTTAGILREAIVGSSGSSGPMPLNGAGVLRAALAGGHGTINGRAE